MFGLRVKLAPFTAVQDGKRNEVFPVYGILFLEKIDIRVDKIYGITLKVIIIAAFEVFTLCFTTNIIS